MPTTNLLVDITRKSFIDATDYRYGLSKSISKSRCRQAQSRGVDCTVVYEGVPLCVTNCKPKYIEPPSTVPILASTLALNKTYKKHVRHKSKGAARVLYPYTHAIPLLQTLWNVNRSRLFNVC
jgi:hypothetical protein